MIRRKRRTPLVIPLASMGDIAFLLIIFFMLTATFMRESNLELQAANSVAIEQTEAAQITVTVDAAGVIRLQGQEATAADVKDLVEDMLQQREDRNVQVRVDRSLDRAVFLPVLESLSNAGATLVLIGEKEDWDGTPWKEAL